jgi:MFS family permease
MSVGSVVGTLLVLAWAGSDNLLLFYLIWAAIGLVMATVLYEPAFAVIAVWFDRKRARALTALTLIARFSSTVFLPLAAWLIQVQGWRQALVSLAVILVAVGTLPAHALLLRHRPGDIGLDPDGARSLETASERPIRNDIHLANAVRHPSTSSRRRLRRLARQRLARGGLGSCAGVWVASRTTVPAGRASTAALHEARTPLDENSSPRPSPLRPAHLRCIGELGLHGARQSTRFAVTSQARESNATP